MRLQKSVAGLVACSLVVGIAPALLAQPGAGGFGGPRMGMGMGGRRRVISPRMLPMILGRPLTAAESAAIGKADGIREARTKPIDDQYTATVAHVLHMTVAQLEGKRMAMMKARGFGGPGGPGGPGRGAPPR